MFCSQAEDSPDRGKFVPKARSYRGEKQPLQPLWPGRSDHRPIRAIGVSLSGVPRQRYLPGGKGAAAQEGPAKDPLRRTQFDAPGNRVVPYTCGLGLLVLVGTLSWILTRGKVPAL